MISPDTYEAASEARNTAAPTNSSVFAKTADGRAHLEFLSALRAVQQICVQIRAEHPGGNGIHQHSLAGPFHGQDLGQRADRGLAGTVGGNLEKPHVGGERGNIDDASVTTAEHRFAENLATPQRAAQIGIDDLVPICFRKVDAWVRAW